MHACMLACACLHVHACMHAVTIAGHERGKRKEKSERRRRLVLPSCDTVRRSCSLAGVWYTVPEYGCRVIATYTQ
mgnify:CR=1 FL=1